MRCKRIVRLCNSCKVDHGRLQAQAGAARPAVMGPKRAPSAYFVFANDRRSEAKEGLLAAATDGKVPSVAEVAKYVGQKWRELGETGQQEYKDKAAANAADAAAAATDDAEAEQNSQAGGQAEEANLDSAEVLGLPLTSVKRIMCIDEDVARISGDGVKGMAKVAELFLELLASKANTQAKLHKRSTIKFCDMHHAVIADKRLVQMGLKDMFLTGTLFADARDGKENVSAPKKACKVSASDTPGGRPITDFFKA